MATLLKFQYAEGYCAFFCNFTANKSVKKELKKRSQACGVEITVEKPVKLQDNQYCLAAEEGAPYSTCITTV
jgi:hypothetical protein